MKYLKYTSYDCDYCKPRTCASLCYLYNIDIVQYVIQNSTFTRQNTLIFITNGIRIGSTCMYKGHLNIAAFIKFRVAQSVEYQTSNRRVIGPSPTVGKNFSFCILSLSTRSWQVD